EPLPRARSLAAACRGASARLAPTNAKSPATRGCLGMIRILALVGFPTLQGDVTVLRSTLADAGAVDQSRRFVRICVGAHPERIYRLAPRNANREEVTPFYTVLTVTARSIEPARRSCLQIDRGARSYCARCPRRCSCSASSPPAEPPASPAAPPHASE